MLGKRLHLIMMKNSIPVVDESMAGKACEIAALWRNYIAGQDVKLSSLLYSLHIAEVID